ncbi:hypothetical protein [Naasia lichenicola]|uniref:Tannase/feruloyl esterase family alpha/beta hydrolase n=1 Tax=Naasia lichenicola TaxID=2565933 RepID=A0A4S4FJ94_9MICO|nr:hypothetical protein [Naasia lichenicola]THG29974.1 hypothetical protein E6C64_15130 [Naasia lichenicola]
MTLTNDPPAIDAGFEHPFVDVDEQRELPLPHRYLRGGFSGTDTRFSLHLPQADAYEGRFFQYIAPIPDSEHFSEGLTGEEDRIGFSISSGAAFLETNGGGPRAADPFSGLDPTIGAYRANAAAAQYARVLAQQIYGPHRTYGYAFGGSGGGFRTIGGAENTTGVWDGFVPYVIGSPMAIPNSFTARMAALRILRGHFEEIVDALEPGGSGDPAEHLDEEQAAALLEVTRMGFPPRTWFGHASMGPHGLAALYPGLRAIDPGYFEDFWTLPGYLGADPTPSLLRDRVQHRTTISSLLTPADLAATGHASVAHGGQSTGAADDAWLGSTSPDLPVAVRLTERPAVDPQTTELIIETGASAGARIVVLRVLDDIAIFGPADAEVLRALRPGDELTVDNSGFLAIQTYHRHQVPGPEYAAWDQFRGPGGTPLFPQRPMLVGPIFAAGAAGSVQSGRFTGRMIVVACLWDREAYAWQADWYRSAVRRHLGDATDEHFRLWFIDRATHGDVEPQEDPTRTVSYLGALHQALRDLAAWVENDTPPPATSVYSVVDSQVTAANSAPARHGIQPVVTLAANGAERAEVRVGEPVELVAHAETPGVGVIVAVEWNTGAGFEAADAVALSAQVTVSTTVTFDAPGTYFPSVRVAAHRDGAASDGFARIQNVTGARVVVS